MPQGDLHGGTKSGIATVAAALALAAGFYAIRQAFQNTNEGVTLLYAVPIALVAIRFGPLGGIAAALVSMGLFAVWDHTSPDVTFGPRGYATRGVALLTLGGLVGAFAADRRRLVAELRTMAQTDLLTGVLNHATFFRELDRELALAKRYGRSGAVIVIDVDRFKQINDTHGHAVGDRVLKAVAEALSGAVRDTDTVGRIGGDEFALLLPEATAAQAEEARQKIVRLLEPREVQGPASTVLMAASVGLATYDRNADLTADQIMIDADLDMYKAKRERGAAARRAVEASPRPT